MSENGTNGTTRKERENGIMPIDQTKGFLRQRKKGGAWHYCCYVNGKMFERSTGEKNKAKAKVKAREIAKQAELLKTNKDGIVMLSQAILAEVARLKEEVSERQSERVAIALLNFRRWNGDTTLDKITTETLDRYQRHRHKAKKPTASKKKAKDNGKKSAPPKTISAGTVNKEVCYVLRLLRENGHHIQKPKPIPGRKTPGRPFSKEELTTFFEHCAKYPENDPGRYTPLFLLSLATGARIAELVPSNRSQHVALLEKEIDLEAETVLIRSAKQRNGERGKTSRVKVARPLLESVLAAAKKTPGQQVFPLMDVAQEFDRICKKAGLEVVDKLGEKLTAHSFRHCFGTILAEQGANAFVIQNVMRHQDPKMTSRYTERATTSAVIDISPFLIQKVDNDD